MTYLILYFGINVLIAALAFDINVIYRSQRDKLTMALIWFFFGLFLTIGILIYMLVEHLSNRNNPK